MSTVIGSLLGFAAIVWLVWRYVAPPVRRLMTDRQEAIRQELEESAEATRQLADAQDAHAKAVEEAKGKAQRLIEQARADSRRSAEQLRAHADAEAERVKAQAAQHIELLNAQFVRQLRQDAGTESVRRAEELVRGHVSDRQAQSATVDRFLDDLDAMAPSEAAVPEDPATKRMSSASRKALCSLVDRFNEVAKGLDVPQLSSLSDDLAAVTELLTRQTRLTRHLTDPADDSSAKLSLLEGVLAGEIGDAALELCKSAVSARWSADSNLADGIEHVAQLALLVRAERDGVVDEVEEQLFWFGRILDAQPRLTTLLSDYTAPASGRVKLLNDILEDPFSVNSVTEQLFSQTVELLRGQRADEAVMELAELAVARRGEVIAHVVAAAELSDSQHSRLTDVLSRIYGQRVSVVLRINPGVLGGLNISVSDEVIDGTLSSRLAAAEAQLPD
jgi:ATP synthase F0 subunit b/ATP synthase F1 delta subunit